MIEKELRLALVCRGGISLAIYIHGVIREFQKLVRASKFYHSTPSVADRSDLTYEQLTSGEKRERDTEEVYFELLKMIGSQLDLRVIVDIIGGASAGGISGVMLARSIAHDLPMDSLRERWLTMADVNQLISEEGEEKGWVRWVLRPIMRVVPDAVLRQLKLDREAGQKLSTLTGLRSLKPMFDGERLLDHLYDALADMREDENEGNTLIPPGHELELFVTVTDFYGYIRRVDLHGPSEMIEREHRHVLRFRYNQERTGRSSFSEFNYSYLPGLAFAARATSSYPGGFKPAQISEVDRLCKRRGIVWDTREAFLRNGFKLYYDAGLDPEKTAFIDGGVLNNKPFRVVLDAIPRHAAYRQVDRRVVYIDPFPSRPIAPPTGKVPGLLHTLKAALSDIPMNEPIYQDLEGVEEHNRRARQARAIVENARPQIEELVREITKNRIRKKSTPSAETVRSWRQAANKRAVTEVGFAYESYVRLKLAAVFQGLSNLVCNVCGYDRHMTSARYVNAILMAWAETRDIYAGDPDTPTVKRIILRRKDWVRFLMGFDADFRSRRLRFVIQRLNLLYGRLSEDRFKGLNAATLDEIKGKFYDALATFHDYRHEHFVSDKTATLIRDVFGEGMSYPETDDEIATYAPVFARGHKKSITELLSALRDDLALNALNREVDGIFAGIGGDDACHAVRSELLIDYLGYSFWDLLLYGLTEMREVTDFDQIRVTRICPEDVTTIRRGGAKVSLKGTALSNFGAFFSRADREHDYLWGRLHGVDRLIDIVCHAAALEDAELPVKTRKLKKQAFLKILDTEENILQDCGPLIRSLREEIKRL